MSHVRAGIFIHPSGRGKIEQVYDDTLELIRVAEEEGLHTVWVSQLHFQTFRGRLSSPFPFLVRAADRTQHIQLATGVVTLPFENPLRLAEDASVTNVLLRGRLAFGVGSGEPVAGEFAPFGVPFEERHARSGANLTTLVCALRGEPLLPNGITLQPPAPNLPDRIWWASGDRDRSTWAAREGVNLLLNLDPTRREIPTPQANAEAAQAYRNAWTAKRAPQVGIWRIVYPADTEAEALERYWQITEAEATENLRRGLIGDVKTVSELRERHQQSQILIKGPTGQIIEQLRREQEQIGFTDFLFYFTFTGLALHEKIDLLRQLAREIAGPLGWLKTSVVPGPERILLPA